MSLEVDIGASYGNRPRARDLVVVVPKDSRKVRTTDDILFIKYKIKKDDASGGNISLKFDGTSYYIVTGEKIEEKVTDKRVLGLIKEKMLDWKVRA